jgi:virginiamycin B lyase
MAVTRWTGPAAAAMAAAVLLGACSGEAADPPAAGGATTPAAPAASAPATPEPTALPFQPQLEVYDVPAGSRPHDVAPAPDGGVWYTAQAAGALGHLDPATGRTRQIPLGAGSRPHGVIAGPDGAAWVTDGGLNAIVRVDPDTDAVRAFPLPADRAGANLNTAAFDRTGRLWFTGQSGVYGRLDPGSGELAVFDAPRGRGPYGITATPDGEVYFVSLAGSYLAQVDLTTDRATVIEPPTAGQGARRVWSDSAGRLWVSEWNTGQLSRYDPVTGDWRQWPLPGDDPHAYAVYVDERDAVWVTDFGGDAIWRFDPATERFREFGEACGPNQTRCPGPGDPGEVRQLLGRPGEVWAPESATDRLVVIRY